MNELSIFAKHTGWDRPLVRKPNFDINIKNKLAEEKKLKRFKINSKETSNI